MTTRTITIICRGPNDYDVQEGERIAGRLVWDEMLGHVAELTHPAIARERYRADNGDAIVHEMERRAESDRRLREKAEP